MKFESREARSGPREEGEALRRSQAREELALAPKTRPIIKKPHPD
jgi:hypothetical protein